MEIYPFLPDPAGLCCIGTQFDHIFRFDLAGYLQQAPTACPWDLDKKAPLSPNQWPRGPRQVSKVFNPGWRTNALYAPCDREPMKDHG